MNNQNVNKQSRDVHLKNPALDIVNTFVFLTFQHKNYADGETIITSEKILEDVHDDYIKKHDDF